MSFTFQRRTPKHRTGGALPLVAEARPQELEDDPQELEPAETPEMTEALAPLREKLAEVSPLPEGPAATEVLQGVLDGLQNLSKADGANLRCITRGDTANPHIPLRGFPSYAGITRLADGTPMAGLWLDNADEDGRLVIDALDRTWLLRLRDAVEEAEDAMWAAEEAGRKAADAAEGDEETEEGDAA